MESFIFCVAQCSSLLAGFPLSDREYWKEFGHKEEDW